MADNVSVWICPEYGWRHAHAFNDPAMREVHCAFCFRSHGREDVRCKRVTLEVLPVTGFVMGDGVPYVPKCGRPHPGDSRVFCALLPDHEGPHGWDYEAGEKAIVTQREIDQAMRDVGLGWVVDRRREVEDPDFPEALS